MEWTSFFLKINDNVYRINQTYDEIADALGIQWMYQAKGITLDIRNLGKVVISIINYNNDKATITLNCKQV